VLYRKTQKPKTGISWEKGPINLEMEIGIWNLLFLSNKKSQFWNIGEAICGDFGLGNTERARILTLTPQYEHLRHLSGSAT